VPDAHPTVYFPIGSKFSNKKNGPLPVSHATVYLNDFLIELLEKKPKAKVITKIR